MSQIFMSVMHVSGSFRRSCAATDVNVMTNSTGMACEFGVTYKLPFSMCSQHLHSARGGVESAIIFGDSDQLLGCLRVEKRLFAVVDW